MKKITSLIDILSARAEKSPERVIYRFLVQKRQMGNAEYHHALPLS